jgi:hypothetical protein
MLNEQPADRRELKPVVPRLMDTGHLPRARTGQVRLALEHLYGVR